MATDGKIYIIVTDKLPRGDVLPTDIPEPTDKGSKKSDNDILKHYAINKMISTVQQTAISVVNFSINNIGNFTGNYQTQKNIQATIGILNDIKDIGLSIWAGFKIAGPWGALISGGAAITSKATGLIEKEIAIDVQTRKANYAINQIRERSGLDSLRDGSRGTEN